MARLLIATSNPAKLDEYRFLLSPFGLQLASLRDAGVVESPEETGSTFAENALLKARYYFGRCAMPALADDGGLEVDALGGAPGVHSHRWVRGGEVSDRRLADEVILRMRDIEDSRRGARLRCAMALVYRMKGELRERVVEASLEGVIARRALPEIRPGFPYRAVLFLPDRGRILGELGEAEEAKISQRRVAIERGAVWLREIASLDREHSA